MIEKVCFETGPGMSVPLKRPAQKIMHVKTPTDHTFVNVSKVMNLKPNITIALI